MGWPNSIKTILEELYAHHKIVIDRKRLLVLRLMILSKNGRIHEQDVDLTEVKFNCKNLSVSNFGRVHNVALSEVLQ